MDLVANHETDAHESIMTSRTLRYRDYLIAGIKKKISYRATRWKHIAGDCCVEATIGQIRSFVDRRLLRPSMVARTE